MANSSTGGSIITGGAGNNALLGTFGNDTMDGGGGSDAVNAGGGNDTLIYRLGENAGASDIYAGGSGIDTLTLQLTQAEWADAAVRAQVGQYLTFLSAASLNTKGELTNSGANNFVFGFPNGSTLMVQMIERLVVQVQDASGQYVTVDPLATFIEGTVTGTVTEDGVEAGVPTATGDLSGDDLNGPDDAFREDSGTSAYGSYAVSSTGVWTYTLDNSHPYVNALETGGTLTDSFTVLALDGTAATVNITITGSNDRPIANDDTAAGTENQTLTIDVLANDSDVEDGISSGLTLRDWSVPAGQGTVTAVDNKLVFTPGQDFDHLALGETAVVVASYAVNDPYGVIDTGTATITITGTNDAPVAVDDTATTSENEAVIISVLGNDTDADDGHVLTLMSASAPSDKGTATVVSNELHFTPGTSFDYLAQGETEVVTVNYTMRDDHDAESSSTVAITVTGVNDAAVVTGADTGTATESGGLGLPGVPGAQGDLLSTDVDGTADAFQEQITSVATATGYGSYTVSADGVWNYTLNNANSSVDALAAGATLIDRFNVLSEDGTAKEVVITIEGANEFANHAPTDIVFTASDPGDAAPDGLFGRLATVDPDSAVGDVHTYHELESGNVSVDVSITLNTVGAVGGLQTSSLTVLSMDMSAATITETFDFVVGGSLDDVLLLTENTTIAYGGAGADRIEPGAAGGQKDDWLFGQGGNDTLNGGAGNDWLFGGTGDDWLVGGSGSDMLTGGAGVDMFMFNSALGSSNIDTILDFSLGDKIVLSKAVFTGFAGLGETLPAYLFNDPIPRFDAVLLYDQATGQLSYDSDGNHFQGTLPSQLIAIIGGAGGPHPTLSATDFLLL